MALIVSYEPPNSPLDYRGRKKFHQDYVAPLGRGRKIIKVSPSEIIIEGNRSGMLNLATNLVDVSLTKIDLFRLEPVEKLDPPGGWYGDLEPNSPTLLLQRIGPPTHSPNSFRYEAPPFRNNYRPPLDSGWIIELAVDSYENHPEAVVRGTAVGLLSLAKHSIYLSQAPDEARIEYGKEDSVKGNNHRLVLKRIEFREDVPWAKTPS